MNNYSIFGPTIYIENQNQSQRRNSSQNLSDLFSNIFSTEFNDILRQSNFGGNTNTRNTTEAGTETANLEEMVFFYEPTTNNVSDGLSFSEINEKTDLDIFSNETEEPIVCVICHQNLENNTIARKINHCSHTFHVHCIDQWLSSHNNCPTCRHVLVERQSRANRPLYQFRYGREN